ncbi:MAG TPA: phytanoyl-CoA dioxygenase family protein [Candidatus Acidoferrales bacterium]|jgi:ectoine hydroxylase-related dioxygenase (phytanoyl-CoA dioxygenase family)|nr:phytanoyl-CoA dioxygenase family protein [Candidatus Acidoferrales bacterium]
MNQHLEQHGFVIVHKVLSADEAQQLGMELGAVEGAGRRGLLAEPAVAHFAHSARLIDLVRPHLPAEPRPVRAVYFNKTAETNWLVAWHQDLTIAVKEKADLPGFTAWSVKEGIPHVQPPVELLQNMLTIRVHLDDCDETNGALRVLAGTHKLGRLGAGQIEELRGQHPEHLCRAAAGDVMLMRPLLLHASGRSLGVKQRRVLHIEYAGFTLPAGLDWSDGA